MGSRGISPVKKSQSTERLSANSAADPAKIRSTRSGSPQIRRTIELRSTKSVCFLGDNESLGCGTNWLSIAIAMAVSYYNNRLMFKSERDGHRKHSV
jgi:hypothetical protein